MHFAHGGRADFRGRHGVLYAFFSAPGLAVNLKTENATFPLHRVDGTSLIVEGTFVTEMHLVASVGNGGEPRGIGTGSGQPKRKILNVSYVASELRENNWGWRVVSGYCGGRLFKLGKGGSKTCEEVVIQVSMTSATVSTDYWTVTAKGSPTHASVGPEHRIDVNFHIDGSWAERNAPHGIFGQSIASPLPRNGKLDLYPHKGHFRTSAMAEGAIEGDASMYEVSSAFATQFAFSRFQEAPLTTIAGAPALRDVSVAAVNDDAAAPPRAAVAR